MVIYSAPSVNRNYLTTVILSEIFWPQHIKNYIGTRESSLNIIFGEASNALENKVQYPCSVEDNDYIEFIIKDGKVNGLKIQAWVRLRLLTSAITQKPKPMLLRCIAFGSGVASVSCNKSWM